MINLTLHRLSQHLILHSSLLDNLGLLHGKMGIVVFLYHYARCCKSEIFKLFADELLTETIDELHDELPVDFANGYCGIGWAITYLLQNEFIEGTSKEILENIDNKIMERDVCRITDNQLFSGLEGILHYVIYRLSLCREDNFFDNMYLDSICNVSERIIKQEKNGILLELASQCLLWQKGKTIIYEPNCILESIIVKDENRDDNIVELNLGLQNGCAGIGLNIIFHEKKSLYIQ